MSTENAPKAVLDENVSVAVTSEPSSTHPSGVGLTGHSDPAVVVDQVRVVKAGVCPSLTARSELGYELGINDQSELYLRLASNTGSGFFSKEWIASSVIEQLITGANELTSTSFKTLFPNKSVNIGGLSRRSSRRWG